MKIDIVGLNNQIRLSPENEAEKYQLVYLLKRLEDTDVIHKSGEIIWGFPDYIEIDIKNYE